MRDAVVAAAAAAAATSCMRMHRPEYDIYCRFIGEKSNNPRPRRRRDTGRQDMPPP